MLRVSARAGDYGSSHPAGGHRGCRTPYRRALPRWLGWSAIVLSPALLVGVAFATSFGFVPYVLTTLWIVATSIVLIRRAGERLLGEKDTPLGQTTSAHSGP